MDLVWRDTTRAKDNVYYQIQSQRVRAKYSQIETLASLRKCQFIFRVNVVITHPVRTVKTSSSSSSPTTT
jgi:hypothetical protein